MGPSMDLENSRGQIIQVMSASSSTITSAAKVNTGGAIKDATRAPGKTTRCMGTANSLGLMDVIILETTLRIRKKEKESLLGQMVVATMDHGRMANNMGKESSRIGRVKSSMASGSKENGYGGMMRTGTGSILKNKRILRYNLKKKMKNDNN